MKVAIIGGGLSGLIAGKILSQSGFEVKVFEAQKDCGGLAVSFTINDYRIPIFYHHIFSHDETTLEVVKDLGIKDLIKKKIKMGLNFNNKSYSISYLSAPFWDFLTIKDKIRFGLLALKTKIKKDWSDIEGLNAEEWLVKAVGKNVVQKIFRNIMREKYGLPLSCLSASELAERLGEEEVTGLFYYPKQGMDEVINRLVKSIEKNGGEVKTNAPAVKVDLDKGEIVCKNKEKQNMEKTDLIINTAPIPVFLQISKSLPADYAEKLGNIKYCRNICVDIGYQEKLSDYYWLNCFDSSFGGIIEHTNLANIYPFKMAWIFKYAPSDQLWKMKDGKIANLFITDAKKIYPDLKADWFRVFRSEYASPLYDIDYAKFMPSYEMPVRNLFFSGVALTYPKIRTMNTAFISGIKTAEIINKKYGQQV